VEQQRQLDFCNAVFEVPAGLAKVKLAGPDYKLLDMLVYGANDTVSDYLRQEGRWEPEMSQAIVGGLNRAVELLNVTKEEVAFLDIGGNVGVHTAYALAAGYRTFTFEPLPQNIPLIRANLCFNDPSRRRGVLFTVGLGAEPARCRAYSVTSFNRGNGVVTCGEELPVHVDREVGKLELRGRLDIERLDDVVAVWSACVRTGADPGCPSV
jgi:FkbM family methyltransferase